MTAHQDERLRAIENLEREIAFIELQYQPPTKETPMIIPTTTETDFANIFERVQTAAKRLDDEIAYLNNIADKLFGEQPTAEGCEAKCVPNRSGRVGDVLDALDALHDRLGRLSSAVHRLGNLA